MQARAPTPGRLLRIHTERIHDSVSKILETAVYDGVRGFALSYFHRAEELVAELTASGLTDVQVFGIEGPAWSLVKAAEQQPGDGPTDELIASAMAAARMAEPYPELLAASSHLLAAGTAPADINAGAHRQPDTATSRA